jgi:AbrB family looped-hinge helix DNA binding protein
MMPQYAKMSSKGQITIPADIRRALNVNQGDTLVWETTSEGQVVVKRVEPLDLDYLAAISGTLSEWDSAEDDEAFRDL